MAELVQLALTGGLTSALLRPSVSRARQTCIALPIS